MLAYLFVIREAITEDNDGLIDSSVADLVARAKRKRAALRASGAIQLGMMRHLYLIIDASECMTLQDLKPTRSRCTSRHMYAAIRRITSTSFYDSRFLCMLKLLEVFINEFFVLNPISQLGIIVSKKKRSDKISELAGNPKKHIDVGSADAHSAVFHLFHPLPISLNSRH